MFIFCKFHSILKICRKHHFCCIDSPLVGIRLRKLKTKNWKEKKLHATDGGMKKR